MEILPPPPAAPAPRPCTTTAGPPATVTKPCCDTARPEIAIEPPEPAPSMVSFVLLLLRSACRGLNAVVFAAVPLASSTPEG